MTWKCENWKWPLVCSNPNISASTWPKLKIKDSFEILRTSRFQNWPSFLNFVKIWGSYCQKTNWQLFSWTPCILYCTVLSTPFLWWGRRREKEVKVKGDSVKKRIRRLLLSINCQARVLVLLIVLDNSHYWTQNNTKKDQSWRYNPTYTTTTTHPETF